MNNFPLKILTPDGILFDGAAQSLRVRSLGGEIGILAGHADCVAALKPGDVTVVTEHAARHGNCDGGVLSVSKGTATVLPIGFQWTGL